MNNSQLLRFLKTVGSTTIFAWYVIGDRKWRLLEKLFMKIAEGKNLFIPIKKNFNKFSSECGNIGTFWRFVPVYYNKIVKSKLQHRFVEVYSDQPGVQFYTCGRFTTGYHSLPVEDSKTLDGLSTNSRITTKQGFRCKSGQDGELCYCAKDDEKASECDCHQDSEDKPIVGKNGAQYEKFGAFSIQPQNYPNAINVVSCTTI